MPNRNDRLAAADLRAQPLPQQRDGRRVIRQIDLPIDQRLAAAIATRERPIAQPDAREVPLERRRFAASRRKQRELQARRPAVEREDALVAHRAWLYDRTRPKNKRPPQDNRGGRIGLER